MKNSLISKEKFKTWEPLINHYLEHRGEKIKEVLSLYKSSNNITPPRSRVFAAFGSVAFHDVKVVIIGQDPYPQKNMANGLAFASNIPAITPKSLINIFKEVESNVGKDMSKAIPTLTGWAHQGVLLLNSTLTCEIGKPNSHKRYEWDKFTAYILENIMIKRKNLVFMLWGNFAIDKIKKLPIKIRANHEILTSPHPSPLSAYRGFFGNRHFAKANEFLRRTDSDPIEWHKTEQLQITDPLFSLPVWTDADEEYERQRYRLEPEHWLK